MFATTCEYDTHTRARARAPKLSRLLWRGARTYKPTKNFVGAVVSLRAVPVGSVVGSVMFKTRCCSSSCCADAAGAGVVRGAKRGRRRRSLASPRSRRGSRRRPARRRPTAWGPRVPHRRPCARRRKRPTRPHRGAQWYLLAVLRVPIRSTATRACRSSRAPPSRPASPLVPPSPARPGPILVASRLWCSPVAPRSGPKALELVPPRAAHRLAGSAARRRGSRRWPRPLASLQLRSRRVVCPGHFCPGRSVALCALRE